MPGLEAVFFWPIAEGGHSLWEALDYLLYWRGEDSNDLTQWRVLEALKRKVNFVLSAYKSRTYRQNGKI